MPKYYEFKIAGYYLYFTSHCLIECMHVHARDRKLTESGSAKFFVRENGDTVLQKERDSWKVICRTETSKKRESVIVQENRLGRTVCFFTLAGLMHFRLIRY